MDWECEYKPLEEVDELYENLMYLEYVVYPKLDQEYAQKQKEPSA
ncbi:hypothetical protein SAMN05444487_11851 [Marininema mesophilum]|uniref:Uncharacterized protein n=1 Tax=Marininema mesophilum TaxID=1048340 RepID=A0A1H3BVC5_9BACL|nr:hypothetical protein [Marininema mesophilum]SDX45960.1 hypothetical protein SAMN05444487_11851 [Marininema mesophilum]